MRKVEEGLGGFLPLEISISSKRPGALTDPTGLSKVQQAVAAARSHDEVLSVRSYFDYWQIVDKLLPGRVKRLQREIADDVATLARLAKVDHRIEQLGDAGDLKNFITPDRRNGRILVTIRDVGSAQSMVFIEELEAEFDEIFAAADGVEYRLTGDAYVATMAMDGFIRDLFTSLLGASVAIFLVLGLLFRSLRIGLISILPNLTPLLVTLGYMSLRGYTMNAGNVIVFAISLGIAVDDTIHFLARFREELARGATVRDAVHRTGLGSGRAIVLTSVLIVLGLSILYQSNFVPTRRFAELTSITMIAALLGDLLLLPACLVLFTKQKA